MHGLTGGDWKRGALTTATKKNDPRETLGMGFVT